MLLSATVVGLLRSRFFSFSSIGGPPARRSFMRAGKPYALRSRIRLPSRRPVRGAGLSQVQNVSSRMRDVTVSEKAKPADRAGFVFRRRRREKSHGDRKSVV